jgi:hypothetical protein
LPATAIKQRGDHGKAAAWPPFILCNERISSMELNDFLRRLDDMPDSIAFGDTIAAIDAHYEFTPAAFSNGSLYNEAGKNNGSCKIFSFARLHNLSEQQTLHCFGDYYRKDVLGNPGGADHQNIRNFMKTGWAAISFEGEALTPRRAE